MDKAIVLYSDLDKLVDKLVANLPPQKYKAIYGVPRGGAIPAMLVAKKLGLPQLNTLTRINDGSLDPVLVVDDIIDSGATRKKYFEYDFAALFTKIDTDAVFVEKTKHWVVFPWEIEADGKDEGIRENVIRILEYIGEDPKREGLLETPDRVERAYTELFAGYKQDPKTVLKKEFTSSYDQMVILKNIEFFSFCEHHMLPFFGKASVAYIPKGKVVGISKLARLVDMYARRLQIQEQMTDQIARAVEENLNPLGVAVSITAQHFCMVTRGVRKQNSVMTTTSLKGAFMNHETKAEFLSAIKE